MIKWKLAAALGAAILPSAAALAAPADQEEGPRLIAGSITNADYPSAAIRSRQQGAVRLQLSVSAQGRPSACVILSSSGSDVLDTQTCTLATERFRFDPPRNARGEAEASVYVQSVRWVLPDDDEREPLERSVVAITATVLNRQIASCVSQDQGYPSEESATEFCRQVFGPEAWQAVRAGFSSVTQVVAIIPKGEADFAASPEWGRLLIRIDADFVIDAEGDLISCRLLPAPSGAPGDSQCPADAEATLAFGPGAVPRREARMTATLFGVPARD